jgi:hypothetical protein
MTLGCQSSAKSGSVARGILYDQPSHTAKAHLFLTVVSEIAELGEWS